MLVNTTPPNDAHKWASVPVDYGNIDITSTARIYGLPIEFVARIYDEYIVRFRQGPEVFCPWYWGMRDELKRDNIVFEMPYIHEVFPSLMGDDGNEFYAVMEELWKAINE